MFNKQLLLWIEGGLLSAWILVGLSAFIWLLNWFYAMKPEEELHENAFQLSITKSTWYQSLQRNPRSFAEGFLKAREVFKQFLASHPFYFYAVLWILCIFDFFLIKHITLSPILTPLLFFTAMFLFPGTIFEKLETKRWMKIGGRILFSFFTLYLIFPSLITWISYKNNVFKFFDFIGTIIHQSGIVAWLLGTIVICIPALVFGLIRGYVFLQDRTWPFKKAFSIFLKTLIFNIILWVFIFLLFFLLLALSIKVPNLYKSIFKFITETLCKNIFFVLPCLFVYFSIVFGQLIGFFLPLLLAFYKIGIRVGLACTRFAFPLCLTLITSQILNTIALYIGGINEVFFDSHSSSLFRYLTLHKLSFGSYATNIFAPIIYLKLFVDVLYFSNFVFDIITFVLTYFAIKKISKMSSGKYTKIIQSLIILALIIITFCLSGLSLYLGMSGTLPWEIVWNIIFDPSTPLFVPAHTSFLLILLYLTALFIVFNLKIYSRIFKLFYTLSDTRKFHPTISAIVVFTMLSIIIVFLQYFSEVLFGGKAFTVEALVTHFKTSPYFVISASAFGLGCLQQALSKGEQKVKPPEKANSEA